MCITYAGTVGTERQTHTGFALSLIALVRTFCDPPSSSSTSK